MWLLDALAKLGDERQTLTGRYIVALQGQEGRTTARRRPVCRAHSYLLPCFEAGSLSVPLFHSPGYLAHELLGQSPASVSHRTVRVGAVQMLVSCLGLPP